MITYSKPELPPSAQDRLGNDKAPVLELSNLSIRFKGHPIDMVDGVSFSIRPGKTLCLVGESGCGKSVTALATMGLLPKRSAEVRNGAAYFRGRNLLEMSRGEFEDLRGNEMAMIFQEPMTSLNPVIKIGDQVAETVRRHRRCSMAEARKRALEMFRLVRIPAPEKRLDEYPHQLSGGLRQRVMIAMALANDPALLIADEPTTALDVTIQAQVLELMRILQRETHAALLMITHDLGVVAEIADDVAVMYAGQVVEHGTVDAVFSDPQHPYTLGLMGSMPSLAGTEGRLTTIDGTVPSVDRMPAGCRFATRCPFATETCLNQRPELKDIGKGHKVACFKAPLEKHFLAEAVQ